MACQVEREEPQSHSSNLHSVAFGAGLDLVSLMQVRGHSSTPKLELNRIRFFDPTSLRIDDIENTINSRRKITEELGLLPGDIDYGYLEKILKGHRGALVHPDKFDILYYLARTHEAILSPTIFDKKRQLIRDNEIGEYIETTSLREAPLIHTRRS
jgi:hypothetical protein